MNLSSIALALALAVPGAAQAATILGPYKIEGHSMAPNVVDGDVIYADPTFSRTPFADFSSGTAQDYDPQRGDIVMFSPANHDSAYIKRISGLPGDTVSMQNGRLFIDGKEVESGLKARGEIGADGIKADRYTERLDESTSYDILDRGSGFEADNFGPVTVPAGHYFVVGDNRDNSIDSRSGEVGMIARATIIGRGWTLN